MMKLKEIRKEDQKEVKKILRKKGISFSDWNTYGKTFFNFVTNKTELVLLKYRGEIDFIVGTIQGNREMNYSYLVDHDG